LYIQINIIALYQLGRLCDVRYDQEMIAYCKAHGIGRGTFKELYPEFAKKL
jgi:hypothetical protein